MSRATALGLFSGGLDSILACRVVADQGVRVVALKFVTPFFDLELLEQREAYQAAMRARYGLEVELIDISAGYLALLDHPAHGFGKHFNPCIDCKILMLSRARELMASYGASFLVTGEVLGQRPMSQRRDTLRVIERDSGCTGLLLRPLCARLMEPTRAELEGLVDRERLHSFSGRSRREQKALAARLGITDYPTPAGGCILTDPNLAGRIRQFYHGLFPANGSARTADDIRLLVIGRQFKLASDLWFIVGRDERDNNRLLKLRGPEDWLVRLHERPGPIGLLRRGRHQAIDRAQEQTLLPTLAGIVLRYGKKIDGAPQAAEVLIDQGAASRVARYAPLPDETVRGWQV